jgi:arylsulfatase A
MRRPNIIVILADDLGYGDIGCDGGKHIRTPHLDRMATEGVRFTDFYASANVCTPSRAGLLTGRYAIRSGLAHEVIQPADTTGLPLSEVTIPQALKPDYATALIGKWHLGHVAPHWPPTSYGFDVFQGLPYSHDMRPLSLYEAQGDHVERDEGKVDFAKLTEGFFARTLAFAEANRDRPFFVMLALTAPHIPLVPNPDDTTGSPAGAYGEVVEEIDVNVGRLIERLKALGLDEDTLVVFTSDNGPWFEGSSGPFRDRKGGSAWDGGFRVPFIARQPGRIPAGLVATGLSSNLDLLPTILSWTGAPQLHVELDGKDISEMLMTGRGSPHDEILLFDNTHVAAVRTARWKLVARSYYRTYDIPLDRLPLLFDMVADPGENYSVASLHRDALADLRGRLDRARAKFDPIGARFPPHVAPASAADHPD